MAAASAGVSRIGALVSTAEIKGAALGLAFASGPALAIGCAAAPATRRAVVAMASLLGMASDGMVDLPEIG